MTFGRRSLRQRNRTGLAHARIRIRGTNGPTPWLELGIPPSSSSIHYPAPTLGALDRLATSEALENVTCATILLQVHDLASGREQISLLARTEVRVSSLPGRSLKGVSMGFGVSIFLYGDRRSARSSRSPLTST